MPDATPVALMVLVRGDQVLVRPRPSSDPHLAGRWEFPGGKIHAGESPSAAARRELLEETGLTVARLEPFHGTTHRYPDRTVHLTFFVARMDTGEGEPPPPGWSWREIPELTVDRIPAANQDAVQRLKRLVQEERG